MLQSFRHWELFIHDDASKADVRAMVEPYLHDARVTFARSPRRLGIGGNWNACLALGNGEYVQYLFQDDVWEPAYLQRTVETLEADKTLGFVAANHEYRLEGKSDGRDARYHAITAVKKKHLQSGRQDSTAFLRWWLGRGLRPNVIGEPSFVLLRRSLMEKLGPFREDLPQALDTEYWVRAMLRAPWWYIADELGAFRVHDSAASAVNEAEGRGLFDRLSLFDLLLRELPRGELRGAAEQSLRDQLAVMTGKFMTRAKTGKKVSGGGSQAFIRIALRHPLLLAGGMQKYFQQRNRTEVPRTKEELNS